MKVYKERKVRGSCKDGYKGEVGVTSSVSGSLLGLLLLPHSLNARNSPTGFLQSPLAPGQETHHPPKLALNTSPFARKQHLIGLLPDAGAVGGCEEVLDLGRGVRSWRREGEQGEGQLELGKKGWVGNGQGGEGRRGEQEGGLGVVWGG